MTPKTCANCTHAVLLGQDASQPVPGLCTCYPRWEHIVDARVHWCAQREAADEPRYVIPDPEEGQGQDGGLDGVSAPQSEEGEADA